LPRGNSKKTFLNFRNNQIMLAKNLPWSEKWWKIPFRMALDQVSALKGLLSGDGGYFIAIIKAHLAFFRWCIFHKRTKRAYKLLPIKSLYGIYDRIIIWDHFVKKKTRFSEIIIVDN
jgi:hypothetical protein